ncbi:hypothetical protein D1O33_26535 (plasmid) [Rhodococcus rhodochrous]|nr:hypothetical protein D1O33_26535 [Rhodococcus rhodochrous]
MKTTDEVDESKPPNSGRTRTFGVRKYVPWLIALVALVLAAGATWFGVDQRGQADELADVERIRATAEERSLEYAVGAATMDFTDLTTWRDRLTSGTSPELTDRLLKASRSIEQIIVPLQWTSTAEPIAAKVNRVENGTYFVDCFVGVDTKNAQSPEGISSTAVYRLTLDSTDDWRIVEISGLGAGLDPASAPK